MIHVKAGLSATGFTNGYLYAKSSCARNTVDTASTLCKIAENSEKEYLRSNNVEGVCKKFDDGIRRLSNKLLAPFTPKEQGQ
jgi:hypothetical protein